MKNLIAIALLVSGIVTAQETQEAQPAQVENAGGIQTGLLGMWVHQEFSLSPKFALRAEVGFDLGMAISWGEEAYGLIPVARLEPRYYYNLPKRQAKGYSVQDNAGNFVALNMTYSPDLYVRLTDHNNMRVLNSFSVIPKWGIRRNLGKHFNYEAGIGVGYVAYREEYRGDNGSVGVDLHLRIGYKF